MTDSNCAEKNPEIHSFGGVGESMESYKHLSTLIVNASLGVIRRMLLTGILEAKSKRLVLFLVLVR